MGIQVLVEDISVSKDSAERGNTFLRVALSHIEDGLVLSEGKLPGTNSLQAFAGSLGNLKTCKGAGVPEEKVNRLLHHEVTGLLLWEDVRNEAVIDGQDKVGVVRGNSCQLRGVDDAERPPER